MPEEDSQLDLYVLHRAALVDYATPIAGSRAVAEDVVQEAWLRFSAAARQPRGAEQVILKPLGYLHRVVRNLALDGARRLAWEGAWRREAGAVVENHAHSPEQIHADREEVRRVADALAELPERTRRAFELHRIAGLTMPQIAAELGISVGLTHQLIRQAVTHCAERLDGPGPGQALS